MMNQVKQIQPVDPLLIKNFRMIKNEPPQKYRGGSNLSSSGIYLNSYSIQMHTNGYMDREAGIFYSVFHLG